MGWYGILFSAGLAIVWLLMRHAARRRGDIGVGEIDQVFFWISVGAFAGGRLGGVLLYELDAWLREPLSVFYVREGGMSFFGGYVGVLIAILIHSAPSKCKFLRISDIASASAPAGLACGRLGNYLNGEIYGPETTAPWGIVFSSGGAFPRHPTQIYELAFEGLFLLIIFYPSALKPFAISRPGMISGSFLIIYAAIRYFIEFLRVDGWRVALFGLQMTGSQIYCVIAGLCGLAVVSKTWRGDD